MPNRYVREAAIESERVNALSWQGEVFFRRLINRADDFGRFHANPALLRASLFPLQLDKVSEKDVAKLLAEAEKCGLLAPYEHDGKRYLVMARWEQGRAKESRFPPPPDDVVQRLQTYVCTRKRKSTDAPDSDSDSDPDGDTDPDADQAAPRKGFQPPSREELDLAASKLGLPSVEVDRFVSYYGSNGWRVGRHQMKSWQHALTGWKLRWEERKNEHRGTGSGGTGGLTPAERRNATMDPRDVENVRANAIASAERDRKRLEEDPDYVPF